MQSMGQDSKSKHPESKVGGTFTRPHNWVG